MSISTITPLAMQPIPSIEEPRMVDGCWQFPSDVGKRARFQPEEARRHPGKLHLGLLECLLYLYTKPGDTLFDPMAGSGGLLYATQIPWCCNVVLHELELPWVAQIAATWEHMHRTRLEFAWPQGWAAWVQGDARTIGERLTGEASAILFSPPYADALGPSKVGHGLQELIEVQFNGKPHGLLSIEQSYDAVVTSPPYLDALGEQSRDFKPHLMRGNPTDPARLQALCQGYNAIITSPPYVDALSPQRHSDDYHPERQSGHGRGQEGDAHIRNIRRGYDPQARGKRAGNPAQIGNMSGQRYADAMRLVYGECVKLLKPGGVMILVIKNVVRKNQEVDLVGQATTMCEELGLRHEVTHWRWVQVGVFHHIRLKHNKAALVIDREAAIVLRKPEGGAA